MAIVTKAPTNIFERAFGRTREEFVRKSFYLNNRVFKYLQSEYKIMRELHHPNIVRYIDYEQRQEGGTWTVFLYTEYCKEGDLWSYTKDVNGPRKKISVHQFWQIFFQLASALFYCHAGLQVTSNGSVSKDFRWKCPVLHRDIKPENGAWAVLRHISSC
jgi:serine/threonine protein kinase